MKETTSFKWTREDGCSVVIENNVATAYDATGNEIAPDTDDAVDLFVESTMVLEQELGLPRIKGDEDEELRLRIMDAFRMIRRPHCCMPPMFGGPMMHRPFGRHWREGDEEKTREELAYEFRKEEMEMIRRHREMEREREARRRQQIIDTAVPYDAPESCPDDLITESHNHYIKENGSTIVDVGHDTENISLYNIVDASHKFLLPRHCQRIERITSTRFLLKKEDNLWEYYDISTQTTFFSARTSIVNILEDVLTYSDDNNMFCYDTDGNVIAKTDRTYSLERMIGGRPVIERRLSEDERRDYPSCYTLYNLILPDGTFLFEEWQREICGINFPGRFLAQSTDRYDVIYSSEDFSMVYKPEYPRHLKRVYRKDNDPYKELYIFNEYDENFVILDSGIIVNVRTGEVVSKDKDGNPSIYTRIEYPEYSDENWKAEVSVKTRRMEPIDPMTGKRIRKKNKA